MSEPMIESASASEPEGAVEEAQASLAAGQAMVAEKRWKDAVPALERACTGFAELGDNANEGHARRILGMALCEAGKPRRSLAATKRARELFDHLGDVGGAAEAWYWTGKALVRKRRYDGAVHAFERACALSHEADDARTEALSWQRLGEVRLDSQQRPGDAVAAFRRARDLFRDTRDGRGGAVASYQYGKSLLLHQRFYDAVDELRIAHKLASKSDNSFFEAVVLSELGIAMGATLQVNMGIAALEHAQTMIRQSGDDSRLSRQQQGRIASGLYQFRQTLRGDLTAELHGRAPTLTDLEGMCDYFQEEGDTRNEAGAWYTLGRHLAEELKSPRRAIDAFNRAQRLAAEVGDTHREAEVWCGLGHALSLQRRFKETTEAYHTAQQRWLEGGDPRRAIAALRDLGHLMREHQRFDDAVDAYTRARDLAADAALPEWRAVAWHSLSLTYGRMRRFDEAVTALENAVRLYDAIGAQQRSEEATKLLDEARSARRRRRW